MLLEWLDVRLPNEHWTQPQLAKVAAAEALKERRPESRLSPRYASVILGQIPEALPNSAVVLANHKVQSEEGA